MYGFEMIGYGLLLSIVVSVIGLFVSSLIDDITIWSLAAPSTALTIFLLVLGVCGKNMDMLAMAAGVIILPVVLAAVATVMFVHANNS